MCRRTARVPKTAAAFPSPTSRRATRSSSASRSAGLRRQARRDIYIGVNALDYSGYPDCRPEFIAAFEGLAELATKAGVEGEPFRIQAPLQMMTKADIVREGTRLGLDLGLSWSCYDPTPAGEHCGECDSCRLRSRGFDEAGIADPTRYAVKPA